MGWGSLQPIPPSLGEWGCSWVLLSPPSPFNDSTSHHSSKFERGGGGGGVYSTVIIQQDGAHLPPGDHPPPSLPSFCGWLNHTKGWLILFPFFASKIIYKPTLQYVQKIKEKKEEKKQNSPPPTPHKIAQLGHATKNEPCIAWRWGLRGSQLGQVDRWTEG